MSLGLRPRAEHFTPSRWLVFSLIRDYLQSWGEMPYGGVAVDGRTFAEIYKENVGHQVPGVNKGVYVAGVRVFKQRWVQPR